MLNKPTVCCNLSWKENYIWLVREVKLPIRLFSAFRMMFGRDQTKTTAAHCVRACSRLRLSYRRSSRTMDSHARFRLRTTTLYPVLLRTSGHNVNIPCQSMSTAGEASWHSGSTLKSECGDVRLFLRRLHTPGFPSHLLTWHFAS